MLCNSVSVYPDKIDPLIFFQDTALQKIRIADKYNALISQGKYEEANSFMSQQTNIFLYSADFFNLIENRIYALQSYLLTKEPENPFIVSGEKPIGVKKNTIWISS